MDYFSSRNCGFTLGRIISLVLERKWFPASRYLAHCHLLATLPLRGHFTLHKKEGHVAIIILFSDKPRYFVVLTSTAACMHGRNHLPRFNARHLSDFLAHEVEGGKWKTLKCGNRSTETEVRKPKYGSEKNSRLSVFSALLTLGAHAQRGLQYLVCVSVCVCVSYSTSHFSCDYSCHK